MTDAISEMWGDNAVQAPAKLIAYYRNPVSGVGRTMIGGVVLSDFCLTRKWERWSGTLIFIPEVIEAADKSSRISRLDQMMCGPLGYPRIKEEADRKAYWRELFPIRARGEKP